MASLPNFRIVDTYKAYKLRERKFTSWLLKTSEKLGRKIGNKKHDPTKHPVPIKEIPNIVGLILAQGESMPESVRHVLQDVISQRKDATAFYRPRGDQKADSGHIHYTQVLEATLKKFDESNPGKNGKTQTLNTEPNTHGDLGNVFEMLELEVAGEGVEGASESEKSDDEVQSSKKSGGKVRFGKRKGRARKPQKSERSPVKRNQVTSIDILDSVVRSFDAYAEDDTDDLYFMIYCFFKDWNSMREYLQERWCDYEEGILSLSAVSVLTNTACELLQRSEKELLSQIPVRSGLRNYQSMANMLFLDIGLAHVDYHAKDEMSEGDQARMDNLIYEEADWICLARYWDLVEWLKNAPPRKIPTMTRFFDGPVEYQAASTRDRMARDRQITYEILAECCLIKPLRAHRDLSIPGEDEITRGVIEMLADRQIPIWLIFAIQIQCDIRYILEADVTRCHRELRSMGLRVGGILENYTRFAGGFAVPIRTAIKTTLVEVDCWITKDFMGPDRLKLHIDHGESQDDVEPFYYLRRHPVLCGLMIFRFSLTMNELGLSNSNQWGATIASAHLYNAVRQELPEFPQWLDMEALIMIHSNQRIFWRDRLPSDPVQYSRSYEQSTGVSSMISQYASSLQPVIAPKNLTKRGIGPVSIVSQQFHNRFCFAHARPIITLPNLELVLNEVAEREIQSSVSGLRLIMDGSYPKNDQSRAITNYPSESERLTLQFQSTHALTNVQLLDALCQRISQESYTLNFDYFSFHSRCMLLLKAVYDEFKLEIKIAIREIDWGNAELPIVPHYIFQMIEEDEENRVGVVKRLRQVMEPTVIVKGCSELFALREFLG